MRDAPRAALAVAAVALAVSACTSRPDTTLHPQPPAVSYAPLEHPFRNAKLFVNPDTAAARWQRDHGARWLDPITTRPQASWLTSPSDLAKLPGLARRALAQRALLVLVPYYIPTAAAAPPGTARPPPGATTGGFDNSSTTSDRLPPPSSWSPMRCPPTASARTARPC